MTGNLIEMGQYQRRRRELSIGEHHGSYPKLLAGVPLAIMRIFHMMLDAPDDPPLVKLAWLLSYFGEVQLPDGNTYRIECGRLQVRDGESWVCAPATFDELVQLTHGLTRTQWQWIANQFTPRETVWALDQWKAGPDRDAPQSR